MTVEKTIIHHCAPTLAGIKPASLVSLCRKAYPCADAHIRALNDALNGSSLVFVPCCRCTRRILLFVYNRILIERVITQPENAAFLSECGYQIDNGFDTVIFEIIRRFHEEKTFPHEAGLFLGYPLEDVRAFIENSGKSFAVNGCWKSYSKPEEAQRVFALYDECRRRCLELHDRGWTIPQIYFAA